MNARATFVASLFLAALLGGCQCVEPTPATIFTDVKYTADGKALLLHATDGIYVARPPGATPKRVLGKTCSESKSKSLDCVRASRDGRRLAILVTENEVTSLYDVRPNPQAADGSTIWALVDLDVLNAYVGQDGQDLAYVRASAIPKAVDVLRLDSQGVRGEIVHQLPTATLAPEDLASSIVVTSYGIAYPRLAADGNVDARFRPWGQEGFQLTVLGGQCNGASFPYCLVTNADGSAIAWQDPASGIVHAYRPLPDLDLPLGVGYDFAFSRGGSTVLRLDSGPFSALVQRADNGVVVREIVGAVSAELSSDGESIAWVAQESKVNKTWRLWTGLSRREGQDRDLGVLEEPASRPLLSAARGSPPFGHSLTGDARFVILDQPLEQPGTGARLVALNTETGESRTLDTLTCRGCCLVAPVGSLVACMPGMRDGYVSEPTALDLYDPATAQKTRASEKAVLVEPFADGSGAAVLEWAGDLPELFLVFKDGRRSSKGLSLRVAASPDQRQYAWLDVAGRLAVDSLP
ncbi:MAG TPA: hypothetical protein VGK67_11070 [Myxococcales bacterium]